MWRKRQIRGSHSQRLHFTGKAIKRSRHQKLEDILAEKEEAHKGQKSTTMGEDHRKTNKEEQEVKKKGRKTTKKAREKTTKERMWRKKPRNILPKQ